MDSLGGKVCDVCFKCNAIDVSKRIRSMYLHMSHSSQWQIPKPCLHMFVCGSVHACVHAKRCYGLQIQAVSVVR